MNSDLSIIRLVGEASLPVQIVIGILTAFVSGAGVLGWIGFLWFIYVLYSIASSPTKQGIHDKYATSMVVKTARRAG